MITKTTKENKQCKVQVQ